MPSNWLDLVGAGLTGGLTVKAIEIAWTELKERRDDHRTARDVVERHLEPVLKAADELVAKLLSLAKSDFKELIGSDRSDHRRIDDAMALTSSIYLFAQFWSHLQILRAASLYTNLRTIKTGRRLQEFMNTLESRKIRLVERAWQRGIGEAIIESERQRPITFHQFVERFAEDPRLREWLEPVQEHLTRSNHTSHRQRLLVYGAVVHSLIDTLDREHVITGDRSGWPNKLTRRSKRDLRYRVFGQYLTFVDEPDKYCEVDN